MSKTSSLAYLCSSISWGGLEMNQLRNAIWMQERGHRVTVFCKAGSAFEKSALAANLTIVQISGHKKYYDFKAGKQLAKQLNAVQATHLIVRDNRDLSVAVIAKRKSKTPLHLSYFMEMQLGVKKKHLLHTIRYSYLDVWSCPLHWLENQVKTMTNIAHHKVHFIPSALDRRPFLQTMSKTEARLLLDLPSSGTIIGLSGRFDPFKGQLVLIEALSKMKETSASICFLGESNKESGDDYLEEMKRTIEQLNLSDRIFIRPFRKDIVHFYKAVDVFVMASVAETFGMVTIEALTSGCSVVATNSGGSPEILGFGEYGQLFEPKNSDDLARVLDKLIVNSTQEFNSSIASTEKYDHSTVCSEVERVLNIN